MKIKADAGNIISQKKIFINKKDNADSLYRKVTSNAAKQIEKIVDDLKNKRVKIKKQISKRSNFWRKRGFEDGQIDWRMSAENINNLVRGLSKPYPGAHFLFKGKKIILLKSKVIKNNKKNIEPGKILFPINSKTVIKCGNDAICFLKTQPKIKLKVGNYI